MTFAEFEHATIVERTRAGMQRKAKNGEWCGGGIPLGYRLVQGEGLRINEEEATVVRLIYDLYTEQRLGSVAVSRHLNEHGYRRKRGRKWSNKEVLDLIRRPVYAGTIRWAGIEQDGTHEPIIDRAKWTLAQTILQKRGEDSMSRLSNRSDFLLTGHIHCGSCGKLMVGCSGHKDGRKMNYYACRGRLFYGKGDCGQDYVRADHLEGLILDEIGELAASPDVFDQILADASARLGTDRPNVRASLKVLEARIGKARAALDRYFQAFETGELESATCSERVQALTAQLRELEAERAGLQRQADQSEIGPADVIKPAEFAAQFTDMMRRGAPASQRKHLVKVLVPRVVVFSREEIDVYFRAPVPSVRVTGGMAPQAEPFANVLRVSNRDRFADSQRPRKPFALRIRQAARGGPGQIRRFAASRYDCGGRS